MLVIMPDNNLSYGLRCDVDPSGSPTKAKPPPAAAPSVGNVGGRPSPESNVNAAVEATVQGASAEPAHSDLPGGSGHHADAAWQHGFACGTAAAAAAFSRQASSREAPEAGAAGDGVAAHVTEVDMEAGLPVTVRASSSFTAVCIGHLDALVRAPSIGRLWALILAMPAKSLEGKSHQRNSCMRAEYFVDR